MKEVCFFHQGDIGLQPTRVKFCVWLTVNGLDSELVLNYGNYEELQEEYRQYLLTTQQEQSPK